METDPPFVKDIDAKAARGDEVCKQAATCLQAMRGVIITNAMAVPSATAYFAAAVAALQKQADNRGLLLVLRRAIPVVPGAVVCARFNDLALAIAAALKGGAEAPGEATTRQALGCFMVAAEAAYKAGGRPNRKVLRPVFALLTDPRPPVRHQAELAAAMIIKQAAAAKDLQTQEFATAHIVQMIAIGRTAKKDGEEDVPARTALVLLKIVLPCLSLDSAAAVFAEMMLLPGKLGQHPVCWECFHFMAKFLSREIREADALQPAAIRELAGKLLPGLLATPVSMLNAVYVSSYATALGSVLALLACEQTTKPGALTGLRMAGTKKLLGFFVENDPQVRRATKKGCNMAFEALGKAQDLAMLDELPDLCKTLLGYESKASWKRVFPVIECVFSGIATCRQACREPAVLAAWTDARFARARSLIELIVTARDNAHGGEINHFGEELSECLGAALQAFGPERVLEIATMKLVETPLSEKRYEQLSRSWMLLVLRTHCRQAPLTFFAAKLLPLAAALRAKAAEADTSGKSVVGKRMKTLVEHIWALLPGFCNDATDLSQAMMAEGGKLAKLMVGVLLNEPELREYVWSAFSTMCAGTNEPTCAFAEVMQESNRTCLATLSSRVLPEMFNAFLKLHADAEGQDATRFNSKRDSGLASLLALARVSDPDLVLGLFKKLVARLLKSCVGEGGEAPSAEQRKEALPLAQLSCALVPSLTGPGLELALKVFTPMLSGASDSAEEEDRLAAFGVQKCAYRAILGAVEHPVMQAAAGGEAGGQILPLWDKLHEARDNCSATALKMRLSTLEAMLRFTVAHLSPRFQDATVRQQFMTCLTKIMPEVLAHLRDHGTAVRDASRQFLQVAATTAIHQELQAEIVGLISGGLNGLTKQSKSSAIDALSRLMYEHSSKLTERLKEQLVGVVLGFYSDPEPQVFRAAVKFTKVMVYVTPALSLAKLLPTIVNLFDSEHTASTKMAIRNIVSGLLKALGGETLAAAFPSKHMPLLQYVQKMASRQERPLATRSKPQEEDEEAEGAGGADGEQEEAPQGGDAEKSWEAFEAEDASSLPAAAQADAAEAGTQRKRGKREPPTSAAMAHDAVQDLLDAWEAESDGSDGEGGTTRRRRDAAGGSKRKRGGGDADATQSTVIQEDSELPLDFMGDNAAHSVLTTRPAPRKKVRGEEADGAAGRALRLRRAGLRWAEDGRLVVMEDDIPDTVRGKRGGDDDDDDAPAAGGTAKPGKKKTLSKLATMRKSRLEAKQRANAERRGSHQVKGLDGFKPGKKGSGDATRPDQTLNPYAYVRLNPKVSAEKHKGKSTTSFAKVVSGAKKGVKRGMKAKAKELRLKKVKQAKDKRKKKFNKESRPTKLR